jgi:hypothetical protein
LDTNGPTPLQRGNKYKMIHLNFFEILKVFKDLVTKIFVSMVTNIEIKRIGSWPRSALLVPIIAPRCAHFRERKIGQI